MAIILSSQAGNWSSTSTWVGGIVPGNGDSAVINHAVVVDVNTTIGASAPPFTSQASVGCYNFAILVNGNYPIGLGAYNPTYNQYLAYGNNASLTVAANITLTARGDTILNGTFLNMNAGSIYKFDSSQATTPTTTVYTIELFSNYTLNAGVGSGLAKIVATGIAGNRAQFIGNISGGGSAGRFTCGEKMVGYPNWDCGILNFSYVYCQYIGNASLFMINLRIGSSNYSFSLDHSIFDTCGMLNHYTNVGVGTSDNMNFSITNCTWKNSADRTRPYTSYGMSIPGTSVWLAFNSRTSTQTNIFNISGNVFDMYMSLYNIYYLNFSDNIVIGFPDFSGGCYNMIFHNNIIYEGFGYLSGGGIVTGWGADIQNCYFIQDSANNLNSHVIFVAAGSDIAGVGGDVNIKNTIFEQSQCANSYYGGNCIISQPGSAQGIGSHVYIENNIVLPTNSSTSDSWNINSPVYGQFVAAGTLITMLYGSDGTNGAHVTPHHFLNNTAAMPVGIGSIDPDENAAGSVGMFAEIRSNIFWRDATAASTHGAGNAVFWNTNGHGRVPTVDECLSTNITNNTFINALAGTGCYMSLPPGEASFVPANLVSTPGYKDGFFSSATPPGTNDIQQNPNFNDYTRNTWKFDMANGGPSTGQSAYTIIQKFAAINDDTGFDAYYTLTNLLAYVRAGFIPTNQTIKGQGYGGVDPGAMPILAPLVWTTVAGSIGLWVTNSSISFQFAATDPNTGYTLTYSASGLPAGLSLSSSGLLTGTLPTVGSNTVYTFNVTITDGLLVSTQTFSLTNATYSAPVWTTPVGTIGSFLPGTILNQSLVATDPQSFALSYAVTTGTLPSYLTLSSTGVLTGTFPASASSTTTTFSVTVNDGFLTSVRSFSITALPYAVPLWNTVAGSLGSVTGAGTFSSTVSATDPAGLSVTYALSSGSLPTGLSLAVNGLISGTATNLSSNQTFGFVITANNGYTSSTQTFSIGDVAVLPPVWVTTTGTVLTAKMRSTANVVLSATDPQSLPLTYSLYSGSLGGLTLNANGTITGTTVTVTTTSNNNAVIKVSNGITSSNLSIIITVTYVKPTFSHCVITF